MKVWLRITALALMLALLCGCSPEMAAPTTAAAQTTRPSICPTQPVFVPETEEEELFTRLFDLNNRIDIQIRMSDGELQKMQQDYDRYSSFGSKSPIYRKADVVITIHSASGTEEYVIEEVGVRMKGNTSRTAFYSAQDGIYNAIHLKLSFQETFDEEEYYGADAKVWADEESREARKDRTFATLEKMDLRWNRCDDGSYLKEYYAYETYRAFGVLSPHVNLCSLNWSGVHMGVYTINEPIDKVFLEKYLPEEAQGGDLYKLGWADQGGASFTRETSIGIEDEDAGAFYAYDLKTNKKTSEHQALKELIHRLNDGEVTEAEYASLVDVEYFLRYAAVSYMLGNPDDLRNNYNNCYIYFRADTGQVLVIPYDYDRCLGVTTHWNPTHTGVTDDNPFTNELLAVDRNDGGADRRQQNPLFIYSVSMGGYYVREFAGVLAQVAASEWFGTEKFNTLYAVAEAHYKADATPDSRLRNTRGLKMAFDLERTSDFASNGNISYREYVAAKQATLAHYLSRVEEFASMQPQQRPVYYIRGDFTGWQNDDRYAMTVTDGICAYRLTATERVKLKVYNTVENTWFGTECIPEDCTVPFETDHHTNIILQPGTYEIRFDPETDVIQLTRLDS